MTAVSNNGELGRTGRRCRNTLWRFLVGPVVVLLLVNTVWSADIDAPARSVQPIVVDTAKVSEWPDGDWVPVRGRELNELLDRTRTRSNAPRKAWIERASYSATFDANSYSLRGGWLNADIKHDSQQPELLSLEPMNLAVAELSWVNQPAIWGTLGDGSSALFVDGKNSTLTGRWNLTGRRLPRSVEFDIQVPKASVSRIRLIVPDGFIVAASTGQIRQVDDVDNSALHQWELDLGSQTGCRITIRQRPDQSTVRPLMLSESTHSYVFREDGVQLQAEFLLDAANAPVNLLLFDVPGGIDVNSVSYGSNQLLSWRVVPNGDGQLLALQLSELLSGSGRPIRVAGSAALTLGKIVKVPQIQLRTAVNTPAKLSEMQEATLSGRQFSGPGNSVFLGGKIHLKFELPLELQAIEPKGYRQTAAVSTPEVSNSLSFQQYEQFASLRLEVDFPKLRRATNVLTTIDTRGENWSANVDATLLVEAGTTFEAEFQLAPMWEVVEVRSRDDSSTLANWTVRRGRGGARTLSIEFRDVISAGSPKAIEVVARRLPLPSNRPLRLPLLRPLDHRADQQLVAVKHSSGAVPGLDSRSTFRPIKRADVPGFAVESPLWPSVTASSAEQTMLLYSRKVVGETRLQLDRTQTAVDAFVWSQTVLDSSGLNENWKLWLRPRGDAVDRLNIYVATSGDDIEWKLDSANPVALTAARVPLERHSDWDLPPGGELWEIQLPQMLRREFSIVGSRRRNLAVSLMSAIATVPGSMSFRGVAELQVASRLNVDIDVNGLRSVHIDEIVETGFPVSGPVERNPSSQLWEYDVPESSFLLRLHGGLGESPRSRTAILKLQSVLADEFPGFDRHLAELTLLENRLAEDIRFQLPLPAVLLSTSLNGKLVTPHRDGDEWVITNTDDARRAVLQIEYQSPSTGGSFVNTQIVPQPKCEYTILEFNWECAVPADIWVTREPAGMILHERLPQLSWSERFFGPLGRPIGRAMFNPFASDSWMRFASRPSNRAQDGETALPEFVPDGWNLIRATSPYVPKQLTISMRRHSQAWVLAWICTLGCLLGGLLMRVRLWSLRTSAFGIWLSICLFTAWLSSPFVALLAGGCVVGSVVALLFPRRLLEKLRFQKKPVDTVPPGSTANFRRFPAVTLLLLVGLYAGHSAGQDAAELEPTPIQDKDSASQPSSVADQPIRVLVSKASESRRFGNNEIVQVEREVLAQLRAQVREATATYLVADASYSASIDTQQSVVIEANFKVYLLPSVGHARIAFPNVGANPANCRVNGKLQPILLGRNGQQFHVELNAELNDTPPDGMAEFDVSLEFRPATNREGLESGYQLKTIAVASARLEQTFSQPLPTIEVIGARGKQVVAEDRRSVTALLGKTEQYQVLWSPNAEVRQTRAQVGATVTTNVTVRPTWLEMRYRVLYRVLSGQIDFVAWKLPHGVHRMVVREVLLDGVPVKNFSTTVLNPKTSRLLVELTTSQQREFVVEALIVAPVKSSNKGDILVPMTSPIDESAQLYSVAQDQNLVGIAAPVEFELSRPAADELGKEVREIAAEDFAAVIRAETGVRPVRFAYEVQRDGEDVALRLQPAEPERKVRMIQTGIVRGDVLHWSLTADLETSRAPVFRHRLRVPNKLEIAEISVREDDVERLVHWSRRGNFVELYLSDKSTGIQSLMLTGERRLPLLSAVQLPLIEFDQADVVDNRLRLLHDNQVDLQLSGSDSLERIETGVSPIVDEANIEFVGQYRILPDAVPASVLIESNVNDTMADSVISISRHSPREWQITYRYEFHSGASGQPIDLFRLQIPRRIADRISIDSPGTEISQGTTIDGDVEFSCQPKSKLATSLDVSVTATIEEPLPGNWSLPQIGLDNTTSSERMLFISSELGLQPVGPNVEAVPLQIVPMRLRPDSQSQSDDTLWNAYKLSAEEGSFVVGLSDTETEAASIPYAEARVVHSGDGSGFGRSVFWIANLVDDQLEILCPRGLSVRAVFVDGESTTVYHHAVETNTLSIPISRRHESHQIELNWLTAGLQSSPSAMQLSQQLPRPRFVDVERNVISIIPPGGRLFAARSEVRSTADLNLAIDKLRVLADLVRSGDDASPNLFVWHSLEFQRQRLQAYFADSRRDESRIADETEQQKQFDLLNAEITDLQSEMPVAATEFATGDFDSETLTEASLLLNGAPNRWTLQGVVSRAPDGSALSVSIWNISEWFLVALMLLLGLPLIPLVRWLVKLEIGQWLFRHQPAAWTALGLFWWTCLRPSEFGFALLFVAILVAVLDRRRMHAETDFVVDIASAESDVHISASQ